MAAASSPTPTQTPVSGSTLLPGPPFPRVEFWPAATEVAAPLLVLILALVLASKRLVPWLVRSKAFSATLHASDSIFVFVAGALVSGFKVFDSDSWSGVRQPPPVHALTLAVALVGFVLCSKWLVHRAAAAEREEIGILKKEAKVLEESRNWLLSTIDQIDEILAEKFRRVREALRNPDGPKLDLLSQTGIEQQMFVIVHSIHAFFQSRLHFGDTLRLGLYVLDETTQNSLVAAYEWDGKNKKCFNPNSAAMLKFFRPEGVVSFIVKSYLGKQGLSIVADTSVATEEFAIFSADQPERIRSALCYRFLVPAPKDDEVWVIYMDSNVPGFFDPAKKAFYETFLQQASKRIAFEATTLQLIESS